MYSQRPLGCSCLGPIYRFSGCVYHHFRHCSSQFAELPGDGGRVLWGLSSACVYPPPSERVFVAVQQSFLISVGDHSRFLLLLQLPLTGHPTFYFEETKLIKHETPISNQLSFFLHTCLSKHPLILPSISDVIACSHNFLITVLISSFPQNSSLGPSCGLLPSWVILGKLLHCSQPQFSQ